MEYLIHNALQDTTYTVWPLVTRKSKIKKGFDMYNNMIIEQVMD